MSSFRNKVVKGVAWTLLDTFTTKVAAFVVTLVLARILTPDDYGTVALLTLITNISSVFIDCGFGLALVQKKDATELDFNSVFYLTVSFATILYVLIFIASPCVARFYSRPELANMLRILAIPLVLNSIGGIQGAVIQRNLAFNISFKISLCRFLVTSTTGIGLAVAGAGSWALVWSTVGGSIITVLAGWLFVGWRPKLMFSFSSVKGLFSFGWKFSASWLLSMFYENVYGMIIGKVYTPSDLAFYDKGRQTPELALIAVNNAVQKVSFPAIAQIQDDLNRVRSVMRRMIKCTTFVMFPMMIGLAVCAQAIIPVLYGTQWLPAVPFVIIMCFSFILYPFHTINLQTLSAIGRSDVFLKLEIIKKIIGFILLVLSCRMGVLWMVAISTLIGGPLGVIVNAYPNQKLLGYSVVMQIRDTMPSFFASVFMGICVYSLIWINDTYLRLLLQLILGIGVYIFVSWFFRIEAFREYITAIDVTIGSHIPKSCGHLYNKIIKRMRG